jgi:hypothetical protein
LQSHHEIPAIEFFLEKVFKKFPHPEEDNEDEEPIKKIADTKGYPSEKEPLDLCDKRVNAIGIVPFHPAGIE